MTVFLLFCILLCLCPFLRSFLKFIIVIILVVLLFFVLQLYSLDATGDISESTKYPQGIFCQDCK